MLQTNRFRLLASQARALSVRPRPGQKKQRWTPDKRGNNKLPLKKFQDLQQSFQPVRVGPIDLADMGFTQPVQNSTWNEIISAAEAQTPMDWPNLLSQLNTEERIELLPHISDLKPVRHYFNWIKLSHTLPLENKYLPYMTNDVVINRMRNGDHNEILCHWLHIRAWCDCPLSSPHEMVDLTNYLSVNQQNHLHLKYPDILGQEHPYLVWLITQGDYGVVKKALKFWYGPVPQAYVDMAKKLGFRKMAKILAKRLEH